MQQELILELINEMKGVFRTVMEDNIHEFWQGELRVLEYLHSNQELQILPGMVSRELGLTSARVAGVLKSLEKKGFITRDVTPEDRRKVMIAITNAGREYFKNRQQKILWFAEHVVEKLGEKDSRELVRIIHKL